MSDRLLIVSGRGGKVLLATSGERTLDASKILQLADRSKYIRHHYRRLIGTGITQNQAALKYNLLPKTITNWRRRGLIATIGTPDDDPTAILIDEADVAYCADCYHTMMTKPGQKVFNRDGSLYIPKDSLIAFLQPA